MNLKKIVIFFILVWVVPATLMAQSESKDLDRIAREQQNIRNRMDHILKKMDRLKKKNEVEGKEHTADLIRRAEAEIQGREILKRIEDLDAGIRDAQLTVSEEQAALLKDLEDIFAILQDRNDLERLEDLIAAYTEGLVKLDRLIDEQDSLLEETRSLVYDEAALVNDVREKLSRIREEQEQLNSRVAQTAQQRPSRDDWWKLTEDLDALARKEEEISEQAASMAESEESEESEENGAARELTEDQKKLTGKLDALRERMKSMAEGSAGKATLSEDLQEALDRSGEKAGEAREAMDQAAQELKEERLPEASEQARSASRSLREASQALQKAGESDFRERRMEDFELAGRQDLLREEMEDLRSKLEKLESMGKEESEAESGTEGESESARSESAGSSAKAESVRQDMESARDQLSQGDPNSAKPHQEDVLSGLEELDNQLKKHQESSSGSEARNQQPSSEQYQELAKRQKELEELARDLMRRLRELPDRRPRENLSNAADNMSGAADELGAEKGDEAEVDQEEAKKYLEKARREMEEEEDKYQNIRQQEVLFRVQQALEELKNRQDKILADTVDFDASLEENSRPTRLQRKVLRTLSQQESEVRSKTIEIREKVEEDGSSVFSWVLERNEVDLTEVVDHLDRRDSGPIVQTIQQDVSDRFQELIESLKMELKRRMEALAESEGEQQPMPGGQQPPEQNALIPPVAELLMIKRMEENALRRIEEFARLHPEIMDKEIGPMEIRMLERLGHQHSSITELFDKMLKRSGWQPGQKPQSEEAKPEEER